MMLKKYGLCTDKYFIIKDNYDNIKAVLSTDQSIRKTKTSRLIIVIAACAIVAIVSIFGVESNIKSRRQAYENSKEAIKIFDEKEIKEAAQLIEQNNLINEPPTDYGTYDPNPIPDKTEIDKYYDKFIKDNSNQDFGKYGINYSKAYFYIVDPDTKSVIYGESPSDGYDEVKTGICQYDSGYEDNSDLKDKVLYTEGINLSSNYKSLVTSYLLDTGYRIIIERDHE